MSKISIETDNKKNTYSISPCRKNVSVELRCTNVHHYENEYALKMIRSQIIKTKILSKSTNPVQISDFFFRIEQYFFGQNDK